MIVSKRTKTNLVSVAFIILFELSFVNVDALVYRRRIDKSDDPLVNEPHSINSSGRNESGTVAREVINHVHHQHEQTIGNIRILTNIDIANLITILNANATTSAADAATNVAGQSTDATTRPDWTKDNFNRNGIASNAGHGTFVRLERNRGVESKPFKFPTLSTVSENSRRVRWPSERHSVHATGVNVETVVNPMAIIVFPRNDPNSNNELPLAQSAEIAPASTMTAFQSNEKDKTNESTVTPLVPNSVNISTFVVNQTAIENELEPVIFIDDDGIFQVKYTAKGENVLLPNADQPPNFTSINKTEGVAIISNDNRQMVMNQHVRSEANTMSSPILSTTTTTIGETTTSKATTNSLIHVQPINNTEAIFELYDVHTTSTSSKPDQQKPQQHQQPVPDKKHPMLFNEHPIFV